MKLMLANRDYGPATAGWGAHMTDEGYQLQAGLEAAGWTLAGAGYGDGCRYVPRLLDRHRPDAVLVADKRDWDPANRGGAFRTDIGFGELDALARHPEIFKLAVVKDAGSMVGYHADFCREIAADAVLTYYHDWSTLAAAPWLADYRRIRTYHSVDADLVGGLDLTASRKRAVVSGARNPNVYPLRESVIVHAGRLGLDVLPHPGYSNRGNRTPEYLRRLSGYRLSVATASVYGFALRKIIEAVACGCTPVTNLPDYDVLPAIDDALVRVSDDASLEEIGDALAYADRQWELEERLYFVSRVLEFYGYRAMGERLDRDIAAERERHGQNQAV
jgi:hypothetical protein